MIALIVNGSISISFRYMLFVVPYLVSSSFFTFIFYSFKMLVVIFDITGKCIYHFRSHFSLKSDMYCFCRFFRYHFANGYNHHFFRRTDSVNSISVPPPVWVKYPIHSPDKFSLFMRKEYFINGSTTVIVKLVSYPSLLVSLKCLSSRTSIDIISLRHEKS